MVFLQETLANAMDQGDQETVLRVSRMIDELTVAAAMARADERNLGRGA